MTARWASLLVLSCLAWSAPRCEAQEQPPAADCGRFRLVEANSSEVLVLDSRSGVLFAVNLRQRRAMLMDPVRGQAITRRLEEREAAPAAGKPHWPARAELDRRGEQHRYEAVPGDQPAVFDSSTGRVYLLDGPRGMRVLDPVAGTLTHQPLVLDDTAVALDALEADAVSTLRAVAAAEQAYRSKQGDGSYGSLSALIEAGLLDPQLASGEHAYRLRVEPSSSSPDARWLATAEPVSADPPRRSFLVNQEGAIYAGPGPLPFDAEGCTVPAQAVLLED